MFSSKEEHKYFWVSHAQLVQAVSIAILAGMVAVAVYLQPRTAHPPLPTPYPFTHMQEDFTQRIQGLYNSSEDSYRLATPPVLRQILYHNLLPCEANFQPDYDPKKCNIEAKKDVKLYRRKLEAPYVFGTWKEPLCGPEPFPPEDNRYSTGQDALPSLKCESCRLVPSGYVLQLPFPQVEYQGTFLSECVLAPLSLWFMGHVRNDTSAVILDAITVSKGNTTVERHQLVYERLQPLNLWWPRFLLVTHQRRVWLGRLMAYLVLAVFLQQVFATLMDIHGGGQYQSFFANVIKTSLHILIICLSFGLFFFLILYDARWRGLIEVLSTGPPPSKLSNNKKHAYVKAMYQGFSTLCRQDGSVLWVVVALLVLQVLDLLTCTKGYLYGFSLAIKRLLSPLVVALCWVFLLVLLAHVFHDDENVVFGDIRTSIRTLFVTRYLDIKYTENASVPLMILLHVTTFLVIPLFLGLLIANLKVSMQMKRGRKRWWAGSQ